MIAIFLRGEIDSHRYGDVVKSWLSHFNLAEEIIRDPDITDATQNASRAAVLRGYRGWPNEKLFLAWPRDVDWSFVIFDRSDLTHIHYGNAFHDGVPVWWDFTGGTLLVMDGARRITDGDTSIPDDLPVADMIAVADQMRTGATYERIIAMATPDDPRVVMVEGWARMTAFAMVEEKQEIRGLVASGPLATVQKWWFFIPR